MTEKCSVCGEEIETFLTPLSFSNGFIFAKTIAGEEVYICNNHSHMTIYNWLIKELAKENKKIYFAKDYLTARFISTRTFNDIKKVGRIAGNYWKNFYYEQKFPRFVNDTFVTPKINKYAVVVIDKMFGAGYNLNIDVNQKDFLFDPLDWNYGGKLIEMSYEDFLDDPEEVLEREKKVCKVMNLKRKNTTLLNKKDSPICGEQSIYADPKFYETWIWPDDPFAAYGIVPASPYADLTDFTNDKQ